LVAGRRDNTIQGHLNSGLHPTTEGGRGAFAVAYGNSKGKEFKRDGDSAYTESPVEKMSRAELGDRKMESSWSKR